jgi:hypothetical protein
MKNLTNDDTRDIAIRICNEFVLKGLIEDCFKGDIDDQTEFIFQDITHRHINKALNIKENE